MLCSPFCRAITTATAVVDAGDYTVWRNTLGQNVAAGSGADGNGDGMIDEDDYNVWRSNFGATSGSGASLRDCGAGAHELLRCCASRSRRGVLDAKRRGERTNLIS